MKLDFESAARNNERSNKVEKILSLILVNQENFEKRIENDIEGIKRYLGQRTKKDREPRTRELHEIKSTLTSLDNTM